MLDLKSMSDEEFNILVVPSVPRASMYVKIEENGGMLLSSKLAAQLSKIPLQIRFNNDCTAIQLVVAESECSVMFPKNGRKMMPNAAKILRERKISFPVVYRGEICEERIKWRGERQENPTKKQSTITRSIKKK